MGQGWEGNGEDIGLFLIGCCKFSSAQSTDKFYSNIPFQCKAVPLKQHTTCEPHRTLVQNGDRGR